MLKGAKTTDKLISEDGSTELLPKGSEISQDVLKEVPFELLGYLPLELSLEEELSEYFADIRNRINRVKNKTNEVTNIVFNFFIIYIDYLIRDLFLLVKIFPKVLV